MYSRRSFLKQGFWALAAVAACDRRADLAPDGGAGDDGGGGDGGDTPGTWRVAPAPTFIRGAPGMFDLAATLPSGTAPGGKFGVAANGTALPPTMTLSAAGILSAGSAPVGATSDVVFTYAVAGETIASTPTTITVVATSALATAAVGMQPGQWLKLSGTAGLAMFGSPQGEGAGGIRNAYCTKFAFDPAGRRFLFISDDHDAQDHFFVYDEAANAWSEGPALPWTVSPGSAIHGYEHNVFVPELGKFFFRLHRGMQLRRWDGGSTWGSIALQPALSYASAASGITWFPDRHHIIVFQVENGTNGALVGIDPDDGSQHVYVSSHEANALLPNTGDPHNFCHYNPKKKLVWFGGGNGASTSWTLNAAGAITRMADIPAGVGNIGPGNVQALPVYDPVSGNFLVFVDASTHYVFDPSGTGTWTRVSATNAMWAAGVYDASEPTFGTQACPRPDLGVIVFVKGVGRAQAAEMWLYKPMP